jgi:phosphate transport system permease protein
MTSSNTTFTGRSRRRQTRRSVLLADIAARLLITVGGISTIVAVSLVCVFLVWVALPLFLPAKVQPSGTGFQPVSAPEITGKMPVPPWQPWHITIDEYRLLAAVLLPDGSVGVLRLDDGKLISRQKLPLDQELTAVSFASDGVQAALGFADGTVQLGRIGFQSSFIGDRDLPAGVRQALARGDQPAAEFQEGLLQRTAEGQFRLQRLKIDLQTPVPAAVSSPVRKIDHVQGTSGPTFCVLTDDGQLRIRQVRIRKNRLTGKSDQRVTEGLLPYTSRSGKPPDHVLMFGLGESILLAWEDGHAVRYDTRDLSKPRVAEELDLLPDPTLRITAMQFLIGRATVLVGDSSGQVHAWFRTKPQPATPSDGAVLVSAHHLSGGPAAVTKIASSSRSRVAAVGYADGAIRLFHLTSAKLLAVVRGSPDPAQVVRGSPDPAQPAAGAAIDALAISSKDDGLVSLAGSGLSVWDVNLRHPEATLATLFLPVWYEEYARPEHVWQTSSGSQATEPKFGLAPLVFGTLKATFYSMLFGAPLALLAALYSSEFLHPRVKARIKPTIELMASLPSVVLGFLAALVFAPFVEQRLPATILSLLTIPFAFLVAAHVWQLFPQWLALRLARTRFIYMLLVALPAGILAGRLLGPPVERWLFAGDIRGWLDGQVGGATGGWMLLFLPLSGVATLLLGREVNSALRPYARDWSRGAAAVVDLLKFVAGVLLTLALALFLSFALASLRFDPRGSFIDTYMQRNALVVGLVMGFAIIPIIYTIADDALSTVPSHLRSASLGAGATPWQTAVRIVIPTAMSGLFSAVMIGLGRAVGETMIVLMAAGSTPIMDMNIFNGFLTLSANIATELPEAARNSTHYRILFLSALTLFGLTLIVNTVAEMVRQRFRRRAYEL